MHRKRGKIWITVNNGTTRISARGPTVNDIPPVHLSKIDKITNSSLNEYIHEIHDEYKSFNSNRQLTRETLDSLMAETQSNDNDHSTLDEDLKLIPSFFFDENFQLDDPRTFAKMTENSDILLKNNVGDNNKALTNNNILQEKLSWYLDTVEIHLINEISKSSNSFFSALDDLKEITSKSKSTGNFLDKLESNISSLDQTRAQSGIKVLKKVKKSQNLIVLENSLLQVKLAMKIPDIAEDFYYKSQYQLSLDFMDLFYNVIHGNMKDKHVKMIIDQDFKLIDISSLILLENLKSLVHKLRSEIGTSYVNLFVDLLLTDLRDHYENTQVQDSLDRISFSVSRESRTRSLLETQVKVNDSYATISDEFETGVHENMKGLLRCHNIITSFQVYQQKLVPEVKNIIRELLPHSNINDVESTTSSSRPTSVASSTTLGTGSKLGNDLRAMTPKEFEDMLVNIYTRVSECLRRLKTQQKFLLNLLLELISNSDDPTYADYSELFLKLDITKCINQCIDKIQERMAKIISVRRDQTIKLTVPFFLRFYSINKLFSQECESISGSNSLMLIQDTVSKLTKSYVANFPNLQSRFIVESVEREIWKDVPLPMNLQDHINEIIESAEADPEDWVNLMRWDSSHVRTEHSTNPNESVDEEQRKTVIIDDKSFIVPAVSNQLVQMIKDFLLLKTIFHQNSSMLQQNLIDILKMVNERINQQVLGANVKRTTELKHITSKHLAIATQLLASIIALIPYVKKSFGRDLDPDESVDENYDHVISEYKDHQSLIYTKLISLMNDRVQLHCKLIATIDWSEPLKNKSCHPYMESLVKETTTISRVLQRYLPELQVSIMLSQIFDNYKTHLINLYSKLEIKDSISKLIILKDIDYFRVNLSDLTGYGQSGQMIWETVNNMEELES